MSSAAIFNGSSRYSSDLQQVLARAVAIASLPLQQLNNQLNTLQSRSAALDSVDGKFAALLTAIQGIGSANTSTSAAVSDETVLTAHTASTALPGSYSVHVIDPGSPTTTLSANGLPAVQNPSQESVTSASELTLTVGGDTFTIDPASNSLSALADAINTSGANVTATIVNLGSPSAPDYRLSVQSTTLGDIAIQLNDGSQDLLSTLSTGSQAQYQVNGQPSTPISSDSRTVTISPGLTVDLLQAGDATIQVAHTQSALSDALSSLAAAYNAAVDELAQHRGQSGGALTGDALVSTLSQSLRNLAGYAGGSGYVQNLTDLGLTFDSNGKLSFDQAQFDSVASAHPTDVAAFLGSATSGGFLQSATDLLNGLEDPLSGTIETARTSAQDQITKKNQAISDEQDRIDQLQASLTAQLSAADALIASLEQKVTYLSQLFDTMNSNARQNG
jgi:flagellar hook-associated protein 2